MEFRDLKAQYRALKPEIDKAIAQVIESSGFILGAQVAELEKRLAAYVGVRHCVTCANGTDALELALKSWEIGPGDAVFVPDFTFFSTAEVAARLGATPVFVDIDAKTFNLDPEKLEATIQKVEQESSLVPRAVIAVDLFGLPADYDRIGKIAANHGLRVLEDGAQGFGGSIRGRKACSFGGTGTTSFFPAKPLGCYGDGGAIFTDDDAQAALLRSLRVHGKGTDKYDNVRLGYNSRLDTLQAAILLPKLTAFETGELNEVNRAAAAYSRFLNGFVVVPEVPEGFVSSWAQYTIRLRNETERDGVRQRLADAGIPTGIYYRKPLHSQKAFAGLPKLDTGLETAEDACSRVLSLPIHPYLTNGTIEKIAGAVQKALGLV